MRRILFLTLIAASILRAGAQGRVYFDNFDYYVTGDIVTLWPYSSQANARYPGAEYSVQLLWIPGVVNSLAQFFWASPGKSAPVSFLGSTGSAPEHGPWADGAGLFDGGRVDVGQINTFSTFLVRAWYNGGTYSTYEAAAAAGRPIGVSLLFTMAPTVSPVPLPITPVQSFQIGVLIPEPSPAVLALGAIVSCAVMRQRGRALVRPAPTNRSINPQNP